MAVSVGAVAITAFSANAAQSTEEVSASVSAGASGYINASYVNLRSGAGTNYSVITCMAKNHKDYADYTDKQFLLFHLNPPSQNFFLLYDYAITVFVMQYVRRLRGKIFGNFHK